MVLAGTRDAGTGQVTPAGAHPGLAWRPALFAGRGLTLVVLVTTTLVVVAPGHRPAAGAALAVSLSGSAYGLRFGPERWRERLVGLSAFAAGGIALVALDGAAPGWLAGGVAITAGLVRLPPRPALAFAAAVAVAVTTAPLARGAAGQVAGIAAMCGGCAVLGLILGGVRTRAETAERLLAVEQEARAAAAEAARYAEREHLAREIHDILAHTLSAQTILLEAARALLERGEPRDAVRERIESAQRLARDGLEETRRAVHSLRGETRPLPDTLRALAATAGAVYRQEGETRPLPAGTALALERAVQEGLTNARKHAPGATVAVALRLLPDRSEVEVTDTGATGPVAPLGSSGSGYGLAGMRERADLIGADLVAGAHPVGPDGKGFRVCLSVPRIGPSAS